METTSRGGGLMQGAVPSRLDGIPAQPADAHPTVRIFISSPSDVRPERLKAEQIIARLDREFAYHCRVEAVLWEREPLVATRHFQDAGNIPEPHRSDIVVVILWTRLGVLLPEEKFRGALSGAAVTGTEWEFEDALAGARASGRPDLLLYRKEVPLTADLSDRRLLEERLAQLDLVERFVGRWFRTADGRGFTAASHGFAGATDFEDKLYEHLRALLKRRVGEEAAGAEIRWHGPPFRGLAPFGPEHAPVFFGRTRARNEIRERLARLDARKSGFLLVLGASGSGKSSLVKAGLLPDLALPGMVGRVALLRHAALRPSDGGEDPLAALAAALLSPAALPDLARLGYTMPRLADLLRTAPGQAVLPVEQGLAAASADADLLPQAEVRLLVLVDQLEELFTAEAVDGAARDAFAAALEGLVATGAVWVLATMRSDFFDRLEAVPRLARLAEGDACYRLLPPDAAELAQIVRQPAREAGLRFGLDAVRGVSLDDVVLDDAARDRGALPLVSFLLDQLWRRRSPQGVLTAEAYAALGGLEGALGQHAETVMADLPPEQQAALPELLRAVVAVGEGDGAAATSRVAPLARFPEGGPARALVEALLHPSARLLVADDSGAPGAGAFVRVAHEALLSHWRRARDWIAERPADLQLEDRIEAQAKRWAAAAPAVRPALLLRSGLPLSEAGDLLGRRPGELSDEAIAFVTASRDAEAERMEAESRRAAAEESLKREAAEAEAALARQEAASARRITARTRLGLAVACALFLVAAGFAWLSVERTGEARASTAAALARLRDAQLKQSRFVAEHAGQQLAAGYPDVATLEARAALPADFDAPDRPFDPYALTVMAEARAQDRTLAVLGHGGFVDSAAPSPDGSRVVTASRDGTAVVWDTATGAPRATLSGHGGGVLRAAFDPAGQRVVTASADRIARVWNADTGAVLAVLRGHRASVAAAVFSPDGARVLTASDDGTARVWDAGTGAELLRLDGHTGWVRDAVFSPDGGLVATASADGTARIWDASSGAMRRVLTISVGRYDGQGWVKVVQFSPDGALLLTAGSDLERAPGLWDVATGASRATLKGHTGEIEAAAFSPDGRSVVTASADGTARLWDVATGQQRFALPHTGSVTDAKFSPDGTRIVTASTNNLAIVWNAVTGERLAFLFGHHGIVSSVAMMPDDRRVVTASGDGTGRLWDATGPELAVLKLASGRALESPTFSPDGRRAAVVAPDDAVLIFDPATGAVDRRLAGHGGRIAGLAWRRDGARVATASADGTARIWDAVGDGAAVVLAGHGKPVTGVAFSPDGSRVLTSSRDGTARIWDAVSGAEAMALRGHAGAVSAVAFSPDGRRVATASEDGTARLWDAASGETLAVLRGHRGPVESIAYDGGGTRLLTASQDGTAMVWDAATAKASHVMDAGRGPVTSTSWSPRGDRLVTSYRDSTSAVWDAATGIRSGAVLGDNATWSPDGAQIVTTYSRTSPRVLTAGDRSIDLFDAATGHLVAVYLGHTNALTGIAFSPDGTRLLSSSFDGTARVWNVWRLSERDTVAYADVAALRRMTPSERNALFLDEATPEGAPASDDPVALCDRLAGATFDPRRRGTGVAFAALDAPRAVAACRAAVASRPGEMRLAYQLGRALQRAGQIREARDAYTMAARGGYPAADHGLAILDAFGLDRPSDDAEALRLLGAADAGGVSAADFYIAQMELDGRGGTPDVAAAVRWLQRGAAAGDPPSDWGLGQLEELGRGVARDVEAALRHYLAADRLLSASGGAADLDVSARRGATARALPPARVLALWREAGGAAHPAGAGPAP